MERKPKTITLNIDGSIYERYKEYTEKNSIAMSRRIEKLMVKDMAGDIVSSITPEFVERVKNAMPKVQQDRDDGSEHK